jgi:hypothetical protein
VLVRRLVPLCLVVPGLVIAGSGTALAHESGAHYTRAPLTAAPAEEGEGEAMTHVANLQYEELAEGRGQSGSDIEFLTVGEADYALAGTLRNGLQIVDITDPTTPSIAAVYDCPINQGDVQVFRQGARILATYTADSRINTDADFAESACVVEANEAGAEIEGPEVGTFLVDLTDPTAPETVSFIEIAKGSHNQTVHPSGDYLYNSNSDLIINSPLPQITIVDISDPSVPRTVQDFRYPPGQPALARSRTTSSSTATARGPTSPRSGRRSSWTRATPRTRRSSRSSSTRRTAWSTSPTSSACLARTARCGPSWSRPTSWPVPRPGSAPVAGLHIYDISGDKEQDPLTNKLGAWFIDDASVPEPGGACTSHVLRMHPDQAIMTIAWYDRGVRVIDLSGLAEFEGFDPAAIGEGAGLKEVGHFAFEDSDTWSFKTNRIAADGSFFGYGNDIGRGFDVYRFDGQLVDGRTVPPLEPADLGAQGCSGVPVASAYVDRDETREVHKRNVDCVIARAIARATSGRQALLRPDRRRDPRPDGDLPRPTRCAPPAFDGELPRPRGRRLR